MHHGDRAKYYGVMTASDEVLCFCIGTCYITSVSDIHGFGAYGV
jgi:hypothetical protein